MYSIVYDIYCTKYMYTQCFAGALAWKMCVWVWGLSAKIGAKTKVIDVARSTRFNSRDELTTTTRNGKVTAPRAMCTHTHFHGARVREYLLENYKMFQAVRVAVYITYICT